MEDSKARQDRFSKMTPYDLVVELTRMMEENKASDIGARLDALTILACRMFAGNPIA